MLQYPCWCIYSRSILHRSSVFSEAMAADARPSSHPIVQDHGNNLGSGWLRPVMGEAHLTPCHVKMPFWPPSM
eukprot:scaffold7392_cov286-Pinguiococcus_pyrenoidosus.AAC.16